MQANYLMEPPSFIKMFVISSRSSSFSEEYNSDAAISALFRASLSVRFPPLASFTKLTLASRSLSSRFTIPIFSSGASFRVTAEADKPTISARSTLRSFLGRSARRGGLGDAGGAPALRARRGRAAVHGRRRRRPGERGLAHRERADGWDVDARCGEDQRQRRDGTVDDLCLSERATIGSRRCQGILLARTIGTASTTGAVLPGRPGLGGDRGIVAGSCDHVRRRRSTAGHDVSTRDID